MSFDTIAQWISIHGLTVLFLATVTPGAIWLAWDCLTEILQDIRGL